MSIVSQEVLEDTQLTGGRRCIRYKFIDHIGKEYIDGPRFVPSDFNTNEDILVKKTDLEGQIAKSEEKASVRAAIEGHDITTVLSNLKYNTAETIKPLLVAAIDREVLNTTAKAVYLNTAKTELSK